MLKLNPDKTEFIVFGSNAPLMKLYSYLFNRIFDNFIHPPGNIKNLGVWFDANFSHDDYVHNIYMTGSNAVISGGLDSI